MPVISVIVPVYKVEAYLPACVESILTQTFTDFELILVDDGSPDDCGAMCDQYALQDARVRVIHQQNGGLSAARNTGMDAAAGEYITFVDSDDVIAPEYLEALYTGLVENDADISCCQFQEFEDTLPPKIGGAALLDGYPHTMTGHEAVLCIYNGIPGISINACAKLYRKALLSGRCFPVGKIHEDQALVPVVLSEAGTVVSVGRRNYYYRIRPGSIMHTAFSAKRFDNVEAIDSCIRYFRERGYSVLASAAERTRKKVNAICVIQALSSGSRNMIPKQYDLPKFQALYYCYKYSPGSYSWWLAKLYPNGVIIREYLMKIKKELRRLIHRRQGTASKG